jgi:hypothetical protein
MSRYLLFICPGELLPMTLVTIEESDPAKAHQTALEALEKWVAASQTAGFQDVARPRAYFTPDVGLWL